VTNTAQVELISGRVEAPAVRQALAGVAQKHDTPAVRAVDRERSRNGVRCRLDPRLKRESAEIQGAEVPSGRGWQI